MGSVEFKRNTARVDDWPNYNKMLDQIVVSNNSNLVIKRIAFNHDYYVANVYNTEESRRRLKLTGFTETGTDTLSLIKKLYNFDYNATPLPGYGKYAMDYWGYYNGADGNNSLIPTDTVYTSQVNSVSFANGESFNNGFTGNYSWIFGNANREPNATYMKAGVLTKITYPTGGYSVLEYEPHQYLSDIYPGQTKIGGGLRINSIKSYNSNDKLLKQEIYKYGTNENGLGLKIFDERNFYRNYEDVVMAYYGICILDAVVWQRNFLGISKYNTLTYQGSPVLYSAVTKYEGDGTNNIGKTVFQYNVLTDQTPMPDEFINSGNYGALNTTWHQGELIKETTYSNTGTQYIPLTKVSNEYSEYNQTSGSGIQVKQFKQYIPCATCTTYSTGPEPGSTKPGQGFFSIYQYPIPTGACRKTKETKVVYSQINPSDSTTTITNFQYTNPVNRYLTETDLSLSEPYTTKITRLKYPQDLTDAVYLAMTSKNILTPVVEEKTVWSVSGSPESQLSTVYTKYKQVGNLFVPDTIKASTFYLPLEPRIQFNQYDIYGNILEQQKTNDAKEVYLWSYRSHYPVAKIVGSDYNTVTAVMLNSNNNITQSQIDAAVSNDVNMRNVLNRLRTYLPAALVTTYTYSPLIGMTSQTDPNGLTTYYEYDTFGRLKNVRDKDQYILGRNYYHYYSDTSSDAPILTLGTSAITLPRTASYSSFAITSDCSWTVSSSQTWLTVSTISGSLSSSVTVTATANTSYARSATVTVTYGNGLTKVVNITQLAGNNTLSTNITRLNFGNASGSSPVTVTSNTSWTVTTNKTWITTSPTSGTGNGTLTIMVSNLPNGDRSGTVTLTTTDGSTTVNISILQGAL
jgi:YD repeat-containing protein